MMVQSIYVFLLFVATERPTTTTSTAPPIVTSNFAFTILFLITYMCIPRVSDSCNTYSVRDVVGFQLHKVNGFPSIFLLFRFFSQSEVTS